MKKGDKVKYRYSWREENVCDKCGHDDYEYKEETREGIIEDIKKEFMFNIANGFVMGEDVEETESGKVIKPYLKNEIKPIEKESVYKIDGDWYTKEAIL